MPPAPSNSRISFALLAVAVAAAYANALGASFQFDDWNVIVNEPRVASLAAWWGSMPGIRALLKLSYALNHGAGSGAAGFHATNVVIHAANVLLVFVLLRRLAERHGATVRLARGSALFGALVFALHPVQTESVTYVSGRSVSLAALFSLASLLTWIDGGRFVRLLVSPALFLCALLTKETAVAVPFAIVLWELTQPGDRPERRAGRPVIHFLLLAVAALIAGISPTYRHLLSTSLNARGIGTNLLTQAHAVVYLAGQLVRFNRLNADPMLPVIDTWRISVAIEAAALVALVVLGLAWIRRKPALAFGILWFFLWLAPTNSLLPRLDVANDRQLYLALLGPAWLVAWGAGTALGNRRAGPLAVIASVVVLLLGSATYARNRVYANEVVFWEDVTRKSPANPRAFNNVGYAYALAARDAEADGAFRRALELDPEYWRAGVNLRLLREHALTEAPRGN